MRRTGLLGIAIIMLAAGTAAASGVMIPVKHELPPLAIKYQRVSAEIDNQVARTTVAQSFLNSTNRALEATYVFPLPAGAGVSEFTMTVNGEKVKGELLEAPKARKIYQDIVNRMKDPGLLEYLGNNLFKARVFPVPPKSEQKVELSYSQIITRDADLCKYVYPLKIDEKASRTLEDFSVAVNIKSKEAIKNIYSPTHEVGVTKKDDHTAVVGFEKASALLDKDFVLYYSVSDKDFGVNLLTHRKKGEDGYFMVLVSPRTQIEQEKIIAKDICFVMDTSGSMKGRKIEQAREALKYCVRNLNSRDRFNIIRFSTAVDPFEDKPTAPNKKSIERAVAFIDRMEAVGGTNIDEALKQALASTSDSDRPYLVIFLTDGLPTQGETTDAKQIVANCKGKISKNTRVFCFGVGNDVNTHLLDSLSNISRGLTTYVKPQEDIEMKVSKFHDKANYPVLSDLKLDTGDVKLRDVYPKELPDLFKGSQLVVLGRYRENGHVAIRLSGNINGKQQDFIYENSFPETTDENPFIQRLWARRKVGYLLDQIRLHGEKPEMREEVVALAKRFGIVTPYTSYLVVPDEVARGRRDGRPGLVDAVPVDEASAPDALGVTAGNQAGGQNHALSKEDFDRRRKMFAGKPRGARGEAARPENAARTREMLADTGEKSVRFAEKLNELKRADRETDKGGAGAVRTIGGKTFYFVEGVWTDGSIDEDAEEVKVKFGSDAYLKLIEVAGADGKKWLMLGDSIRMMLPSGKCLVIGEEGAESLEPEEARDLLGQ